MLFPPILALRSKKRYLSLPWTRTRSLCQGRCINNKCSEEEIELEVQIHDDQGYEESCNENFSGDSTLVEVKVSVDDGRHGLGVGSTWVVRWRIQDLRLVRMLICTERSSGYWPGMMGKRSS